MTLRKVNLLIINDYVFSFAKWVIFTEVNLLIINVDFFENKCKCLHLKKLNTGKIDRKVKSVVIILTIS